MAEKPKKSFLKGAVEIIILVLVILFVIGFLTGYFGEKKSNQDSIAKFIEQRNKIDACSLEAQTAANTLDYKTASAKFSECRTAVNTIILEVQRLNRESQSREYAAMVTEYNSLGLYYDAEKIAMDAFSDKQLTQKETLLKFYAARNLLNESLNNVIELESKYSDTDYFKQGYGTASGQELLVGYKKNISSEKKAIEDMITTMEKSIKT